MAVLYFVAWLIGGGFASYGSRDRKIASAGFGIAACWPVAFFWVASNLARYSPNSMGEAMMGVLIIAFIAGGIIALFGGTGLSRFWGHDRATKLHALLVCAICALLAVPLYASYASPQAWQGAFSEFPYVALAQGFLGACGYCLLPLQDRKPNRISAIWGVGLVLSLGAAVYFFPDVAFRMRRSGSQLTSLEREGAERAARGGQNTVRGQEALTESGDPKAVAHLIDQISRADIEGRENEMVEMAGSLARDPKLKDALVSGLPIALNKYKGDNTFDETDRAIEAYCKALARCHDSRATSDLIRAYNLSTTQMNIRIAAAEALGVGFYKNAEPFIIAEFGRLHPVRDAQLGVTLSGTHGDAVSKAYTAFRDAGYAGRARIKNRDVPAAQLIRGGEIDAIVERALSEDGGSDLATIELIKRKHPKRFAAVEKHAGRTVFGRDFTTFRDPELYAFLAKRDLMALDNRRITRFICEWAPPESCSLLGKLLKTDFASAAVIGLSHCRNSNAPKLLLDRLKAYRAVDGGLAFYLVRALGLMAYEPATEQLGIWASGKKSAGSMVVAGKPVRIEDVASWGLSRMATFQARALARKYPAGETTWVESWPWR